MRTDPEHLIEDSLSLPLYVAGLCVTLCGVLTVTSELDQNGLSRVAVLLTVIGFAFSLACRRLQIPALWLHLGGLVFVAFLVAGSFSEGHPNPWLLGGAGGPDMILAVLLMWVSVLRSWTLVNDDLVLSCSVTTAAMIGLIGTQSPNTEVVVYFCLFILAMTFMLIHQNYLHFRARASQRERARPAGLMLTAQVSLSLLSVLLVLSAGALLIIPAQAVFANLSLSQAIRRLVGSGNGRDLARGDEANRFSDSNRLEIGLSAQWPTGSNILLHVVPDDHQPHYWRGRTYDQYLGAGWRSSLQSEIPLLPSDDVPEGQIFLMKMDLPGEGHSLQPRFPRSPLSAAFDVRGETDQFYYCGEARALTFAPVLGVVPSLSRDGRITLGGNRVQGTYSMTSLPPLDLNVPEVQQKLRRDGIDYPSDVRRLYLPALDDEAVTPQDLKDYRAAVAEALRGLPSDHRNPFDEAMALRDWVANRCTYSLAISSLPPNTDHVHEFLFHTRRGYCDLFASSFVILCRVARIPARVATGFAPGDRDETGFNLRALDKHAWAEVYFPGDRWQIFDPTVGTRTDGTIPVRQVQSQSWWQSLLQTLRSGGPLPWIIVSVIVLLLLFILKTEVYDRFRRASPVGERRRMSLEGRPDSQYGQMTQTLARLGLPRRPSETPAEYEARAVSYLNGLETSLGVSLMPAVVSQITNRLVAARYAGGTDTNDVGFDAAFARWNRAASRVRRRQFWRGFWRVKG